MKTGLKSGFLGLVAFVSGDNHDQEGEKARDDRHERREQNKKEGDEPKVPKVGHWNFTSHDGKDPSPCLRLDGGIRLDVGYEAVSGNLI